MVFQELEKEVSKEEIVNVIHETSVNKAPGSDEYNANFFQANWHLVKHNALNIVN